MPRLQHLLHVCKQQFLNARNPHPNEKERKKYTLLPRTKSSKSELNSRRKKNPSQSLMYECMREWIERNVQSMEFIYGDGFVFVIFLRCFCLFVQSNDWKFLCAIEQWQQHSVQYELNNAKNANNFTRCFHFVYKRSTSN